MKISFSTTIGDVPPVLILLDLPQPSKPIQNTHLELSRMDSIVALNKRITEIVDGEMLQLSQSSIIEIQIIRIPCISKKKTPKSN